MNRKAILTICLVLSTGTAMAQARGEKEEGAAKEVAGMSIVGNNETPKALIIVPWKTSEIGQETNFNSNLLNQELVPVDKPSFVRELEFYKISTTN